MQLTLDWSDHIRTELFLKLFCKTQTNIFSKFIMPIILELSLVILWKLFILLEK